MSKLQKLSMEDVIAYKAASGFKVYQAGQWVDGQFVLTESTSDAEINAMLKVTPPQTLAAWKSATDVAGLTSNRLFSTVKSRGDSLKTVDNAYEVWIQDIHNASAAESLMRAFMSYSGLFRTTPTDSTFRGDYRTARNKNDVMSNVATLAKVIFNLSDKSGIRNAIALREAKRVHTRKMILILMGNIRVEWNPVADAIMGAVSTVLATTSMLGTMDKTLAKTVVEASAGGAGTLGGLGYVGYVGVSAAENKAWANIKKMIEDKFEEAKRQFITIFTNIGKWELQKITALLGTVTSLVLNIVLKSATKFVGGASDIAQALVVLAKGMSQLYTISSRSSALRTSDGSFVLIRKGIEDGIKWRITLAGLQLAKGVTTLAVTLTTGMGAIVNLILTGIEFIFKMVSKQLEIDAIKSILTEAQQVYKRMDKVAEEDAKAKAERDAEVARTRPSEGRSRSNAITVRPPEAIILPAVAVTAPVAAGSMPPFKAAGYTVGAVLRDDHGAYLNFLHSLVNASPVLAAIIINSGAISNVDDVLHSVTSRDDDDIKTANDLVAILKQSAKTIYDESGYVLTPMPVSEMAAALNVDYQILINNAKGALQEPKVLSTT